jgi:hypothetical protein
MARWLKGNIRKYAGGESVAAQGGAKRAQPWDTFLQRHVGGRGGVQSIFLSVASDNDYSHHLFHLITSANLGIDF